MRYDIAPRRHSRGIWPFWKETEDFWDDFLPGMPTSGRGFEWSPSVDVAESDGSVVIKAELPGLEAKDIEVDVTGNVLTLKGEKKMDQEKEGERVYRRERFHGTFQRAFRLPAGVESENVDANFKNGVLTITVPKSEESRHKKIEIKSA